MKKILIIDDNGDFREMMSEYFSQWYLVETSDDGDSGIKKAIDFVPDLIMLDVMMPGKSGLDVIRELGADLKTRNIPVIVITATNFERSTIEKFNNEGNCILFIDKNSDLSFIKEKIEGTIK